MGGSVSVGGKQEVSRSQFLHQREYIFSSPSSMYTNNIYFMYILMHGNAYTSSSSSRLQTSSSIYMLLIKYPNVCIGI